RARAPGPVSGRLSTTTSWRSRSCSRGFPLSFDRRHLLLGHPFPPRNSALLTVGLPAHRAGPRRGFHVPHAQATTGVGALYTPGPTVLPRTGHDPKPASAASQRHVPAPHHNHHPCEAPHYEASTRVQAIHPSGLPPARHPRMKRGASSASPKLRTPPL